MSTQNPTYGKLTKDSLYQLIAMHRNPVGRAAMIQIFGKERERRLTALLTQLENENRIRQINKGYRAIQPWSDLALATIGAVGADNRAKINILNLPENMKLDASIAQSDVRSQSLKEGDKVVVVLSRGQSGTSDLRARFIAHCNDKNPLRLTGHFNAVSRVFTTHNHNLKTGFRLTHEPESDTNHLLVELPQDFDMRNPMLYTIPNQKLDPATGQEIIGIVARKHDLAFAHPQNILDEAVGLAQKPVSADHRVDLRELDFITVDPLGSTDLDDAMCARIEKNGYAFYTAIADVPYIVPYMNSVDRHAYNRGLTHYLSDDHTVHMLPDVLSTDKCSLVPYQDRAAIVVKQILGWDFELKGYEVFAAIIHSHDQLSYGQFYDKLDRKDPRFMILAKIHDERRRKGLDKSQQNFLSSSPDRYSTKSIVETAMVQTNSLAAKFLSEANIPFLSRNYSKSPAGHPQKNGTGPRAYYSSFQIGHGQLGLTHYAHISSPIRRYGDNVNIRALHKAISTPGLGIEDREIALLDEIATHLNGLRNKDQQMMQEIGKYHSLAQAKASGLTPH